MRQTDIQRDRKKERESWRETDRDRDRWMIVITRQIQMASDIFIRDVLQLFSPECCQYNFRILWMFTSNSIWMDSIIQRDRQTERVIERENTPYLVKCDDVHRVSMSAVCCSLGGHAEAQRQVRHRVHDHALNRLIYRGEYSQGWGSGSGRIRWFLARRIGIRYFFQRIWILSVTMDL